MFSRRTMIGLTAAAGAVAASSPWWSKFAGTEASASPLTCELAFTNNTDTSTVYAYVTGYDFDDGRMMLLRSDSSSYYLEEPGSTQTPLPVDCSIPLNAPGADPVVVTLPRMYGARIYFVRESKLEFFVNPGPALVEPSLGNSADANYGKTVSFCEFTFNDTQLFVNVSYVDLVTALPIALHLQGDSEHSVAALDTGAADAIATELEAQAAADGYPWGSCVLRAADGSVLRVISPQNVMAPYFGQDNMPFADYWDAYADEVWEHYRNNDLRVDLQGGRGTLTGRVSGDLLTFDDGSTFSKPEARGIFTCNYGPFENIASDTDARKGALARIAAAFNRSTILNYADQPNGAPVSEFYANDVTNHYARAVHENSPIGYAFPYDDVTPDGAADQSGVAYDGNPTRLTLTVT